MRALPLRILASTLRRYWTLYEGLNLTVRDERFRIPLSNGIGTELLNDRHPSQDYLEMVVRNGGAGTFVDVGANIGRIMLGVARIDPGVPYVGFEPQLAAAAYLDKLIRANGWEATHRVYAVGLGNRTGASELMFNDPADVSASLAADVRSPEMYHHRSSIPVVPGDDLLRDAERIRAVKIDAEGYEVEVIEGLRATLSGHRPPILLEILPVRHLEDGTYDAAYFGHPSEDELARLIESRKRHMDRVTGVLSGLDYVLTRLGDGHLRPAQAMESTFEEQDFLAIPSEERDRWLAP